MEQTILDFNKLCLTATTKRLEKEEENIDIKSKHLLGTRYDRAIVHTGVSHNPGDIIVQQLYDLFLNGLGILWSPVQLKIFDAAVNAMLPKIYGKYWYQSKTRVLNSRGISKVSQEILIQMARRNGKTFVTSGVAAVLLLLVPGIKIAIFSVSERQSKMLKDEIDARINDAWALGTHVTTDSYTKIMSNKESWIYQMNKTGTKQSLGSYPGSVKVIFIIFYIFSISFF
ncbi:hypothetical protein OAB94_02110 [Flavobacteriaceae bacterium]|nr:hypothetical protein [Flavobacteriaceae bacterium]